MTIATTDATTMDGAAPEAGISRPPRMRDVCAATALTVILDSAVEDQSAGASLASATVSACNTMQTTRLVDQFMVGLLDPSTRGPLLGPTDLGVVGGGDFLQEVMGYLLPTYTPLVWTFPSGRFQIFARGVATPIVDVAASTVHASHDYALVQISYDPVSDSTVLSAHGVYSRGTLAGAYWFASIFGSALAVDDNRWHVIEWTNADADANPSAGDVYSVVASGM